jgi:hypothetical protein
MVHSKSPTPFPDKYPMTQFLTFKEKEFFNNYLSHKVCFEGVQLGDLQAISQQILSFSIRNNNNNNNNNNSKAELKETNLNKN